MDTTLVTKLASHLHHDVETIPADEEDFPAARRESEGFNDRRATDVLFREGGADSLPGTNEITTEMSPKQKRLKKMCVNTLCMKHFHLSKAEQRHNLALKTVWTNPLPPPPRYRRIYRNKPTR